MRYSSVYMHVILVGLVCAGLAFFTLFFSSGHIPDKPTVQYFTQVLSTDPLDAAVKIEKESAKGKTFFESHEIEHAFGQALYNKTGLDHMQTCIEVGEGCFHQMIGSYIFHTRTKDASLFDYCGSSRNWFTYAQCSHAIGHGLESVTNEAPKDLDYVLSVCNGPRRSSHAYECGDGVFMEYHIHSMSDGMIKKVTDETQYDPCFSIDVKDRLYCMRSLPRWWWFYDGGDAVPNTDARFEVYANRCRSSRLRQDDQEYCFMGIGRVLRPRMESDLMTTVPLCDISAKTALESVACRWYMVRVSQRHVYTPEELIDVACSGIQNKWKSTCETYVKKRGSRDAYLITIGRKARAKKDFQVPRRDQFQ